MIFDDVLKNTKNVQSLTLEQINQLQHRANFNCRVWIRKACDADRCINMTRLQTRTLSDAITALKKDNARALTRASSRKSLNTLSIPSLGHESKEESLIL